MLTVVFEFLLQEYRTHRMARLAVWILAYGVAVWLLDRFGGGVQTWHWVLFWITFVPAVFYYLIRLIRFVRQRLLWRLRRRLIVTYLFIAVVPILLIILLVLLKDFMISGQFAAFLVTLKLRDRVEALQQLNRAVAHEAYQTRETSSTALLERTHSLFVTQLGAHAAEYPGLEVMVRVDRLTRAFRLDGRPLARPFTIPDWLDADEFAGIVVEGDQIALRVVNRGPTRAGPFTLILSQPVTPEFLDQVGQGIGPVGVLLPSSGEFAASPQPLRPGAAQAPAKGPAPAAPLHSKSVLLPEPMNRLDTTVFGASTLDPIVWGGEKEERLPEPVFVYVTSRMVTLNRQLLATLGRFSRVYVTLFMVVAMVFLVIELFALVIGIRLTRSITNTVDKLHAATERVKTGDFSYRISLPPRDQLTALGEAFDGMTASVERLLRESREKSRLEGELEIAREVQRQLFPQTAPKVPGLEVYGVCKPARSVSGDYYDFLRLGEDRIGLVLGDVSGKGISAALLMAAIQAALRAQFYDGVAPQGAAGAVLLSAAEVVERLNRQLFESTPVEKYATFFFAEYNAGTRQLTYTNAGHLPPVLFRRGAIQRLETGGTVVGLFWPLGYEQAVLQLEPGDLLLAFTDGITEPENSYGEEFGEARVLEVARRGLGGPPELLVEEIYRSVNEWTGSPELQDDMTLLVAKATA